MGFILIGYYLLCIAFISERFTWDSILPWWAKLMLLGPMLLLPLYFIFIGRWTSR